MADAGEEVIVCIIASPDDNGCQWKPVVSREQSGGGIQGAVERLLALREVQAVTGEILKPAEGKNIFAQALSALGASKGGKPAPRVLARINVKPSPKKAATARWARKD